MPRYVNDMPEAPLPPPEEFTELWDTYSNPYMRLMTPDEVYNVVLSDIETFKDDVSEHLEWLSGLEIDPDALLANQKRDGTFVPIIYMGHRYWIYAQQYRSITSAPGWEHHMIITSHKLQAHKRKLADEKYKAKQAKRAADIVSMTDPELVDMETMKHYAEQVAARIIAPGMLNFTGIMSPADPVSVSDTPETLRPMLGLWRTTDQ